MALTRIYKVNLSQNGYSDVVHFSQYDTNYSLVLDVYNGLDKADLTGYTAVFKGTRADGLGYSFTGTVSGNKAMFTIDTTCTGVAGKSNGEVVFSDAGGMVYGSANFVTDVEKSAVPNGTVDADVAQAQSAAEIVAQYAAQAEASAEEARIKYGSPLIAPTASAMTETNRVYVYTGSETGYVNGNWYYYDGSAWVSGGVYTASGVNTDTTLAVAGMPADAKAAGDKLTAITVRFSDPNADGNIVVTIGS